MTSKQLLTENEEEAISKAMSKGLEPLLTVKETKLNPRSTEVREMEMPIAQRC